MAAGHSVSVMTEYSGEPCDALIALHAWRSVGAVRRFRQAWPGNPLIVALTGTDIYHHQHEFPQDTLYSMAEADALIGLHALVKKDIPARYACKLVTLFQSADGPDAYPSAEPTSANPVFNVCVIGHLRDEKDSLRAAYAARLLPAESRIRILCAGKSHNKKWQKMALQERQQNPRFNWLGELEKADTRQLMANSHSMVISSVMEGGANVVSEACRVGLPVIASDIPGNLGLLGEDYPGYFPVKDEKALADRLYQAEQDPDFLARLKAQIDILAERFVPENEQASLAQALNLAVQLCAGRKKPNPGV